MPTLSSDCSGNSSRVCRVLNATTVPIEIAAPPAAIDCPANQ